MNTDKLLEPKLKGIPKVPDEFGEDGGHFYRYYNDIAGDLDEDMVTSLKAQLDGILIFTGLFAGINTAFLALTLPEMRADPADDTNALLLQLVTGGNGTIRSAEDLPSAAFSPSPGVFPVNVPFSLSLTLAIFTAFLAVLGQQWLVYYRKRSGGGIEHQRWEQLRRHLGARHWRLEGILDDILPMLLQLALVIFCIAFFLYLQTLSKTMSYVIASPMGIASVALVIISVIPLADKWCPFKSTLPHLLQLFEKAYQPFTPPKYLVVALVIIPPMFPILAVMIVIVLIAGLNEGVNVVYFDVSRQIPDSLQNAGGALGALWRESWQASTRIVRQLTTSVIPPGEALPFLRAAAIRRVICTSEDFNTLIYTAVNMEAIREKEGAEYLLKDDTVHERLKELIKSSEKALASAFSCAFAHLLLGGQSAELFVGREERRLYRPRTSFPRLDQYRNEPHPLKETVRLVSNQLKACTESADIHPKNFFETVLYFELLELLLDERSGSEELSKWLDRVIQQQQPSKVSKLLVISLVAYTVLILNTEIESVGAPSGRHISFGTPDPEQEGQDGLSQERERDLLAVQQHRVDVVKLLISTVGWKMRPVHSNPRESSGDATPDSASPQGSLKADRLQCASVLSKCLHYMRDHLKPDEFSHAVSPALNKLVDHWTQFADVRVAN
ncbi:hypothetical protein FS837_001702, partial [Tulasnella sp. UAMH 9824]